MASNRLTVLTLTVGPVVAALLMAAPAAGQTARIEIHSFDTMTLTNKQFLTGAKDGTPVRISGELRLPRGTARVPAVVLVHGSGGIGANDDQWAQELNGIGVAAFLVDSFTPRGIDQTVTDQSKLGNLAMIVDAYRALDLLSKHPRIDASRIAVMGFSRGGFVALYASMKRFQRMYGTEKVEFSAYIPFYAPCFTRYMEDGQVSDRPIRMFHGEADDWAPVGPCRDYVERLRRSGKDVQLTVYPEARHVFDNPLYPAVLNIPAAQNSKNCPREEREGGVIINLETGQPFGYKDACVSLGATVGYNAQARTEAVKAVKEFLKSTWRLSQ